MSRTFYDLMMISPYADRELIVVVYRHLAKRFHPDKDRSPEAASRMMELNDAYATLSDKGRRARYDETIGIDSTDDPISRRVTVEPPADSGRSGYGESGPPPANPAPRGSSLTFGRYRGWTLNQVGRYDRDYLEWLSRTTMGRNYRHELELLLQRRP